ncbi:MAG: antibiotic biosynthesis monooxygenase [Caulobacterales bacterium]|nr:antibiotic biosynthesis monooxygenase [Caulobacterales bacterium]
MSQVAIFARFHARQGQAQAVAAAIAEVVPPTRAEAGCLGIEAFAALRDPDLFFIHSQWSDEAAFEAHARLPHTVRFLATVAPLIDHPLDVQRTKGMPV